MRIEFSKVHFGHLLSRGRRRVRQPDIARGLTTVADLKAVGLFVWGGVKWSRATSRFDSLAGGYP